MNKSKLIVSILIILSMFFTSCSTKNNKEETLKIAASITPHTEILEFIKPKLKEKGVNLEIVQFDADDQLNQALDDKLIDANFAQHLPALEFSKREKGYNFEVAGKVHIEPIGLYSDKIKSINEIKDGATIGIPNNPSNEYRALKLLVDNNLIKLKDNLEEYTATPNDIVENTKNLKFIETDAAQLPRVLQDLEGAIINTNIVLEAGIDTKSAIIKENANSPYANIVVVRTGDKDRKDIKVLIQELNSDEVRKFINDKYNGAVIPAF